MVSVSWSGFYDLTIPKKSSEPSPLVAISCYGIDWVSEPVRDWAGQRSCQGFKVPLYIVEVIEEPILWVMMGTNECLLVMSTYLEPCLARISHMRWIR